MASSRAAQRYAKALVELAGEKNILVEVNADMRLIHQTIADNKELANVLKSPVVKPSDKLSILKKVFDNTQDITGNSFDVLVDNGRVDQLDKVAQKFIEQYDALQNVTVAEVTTAEELTPEMEKKVLDKVQSLTGKQATLKKIIDKTILGGFILRVGDIQYDASVSGNLNRLKNKLNNNAYILN
ncbi:ATP synthase F1 subunit delta [Mesonia sp. K7]|uniref:ATP synthase F1 subunit delta n=1 Tax=Mesonia sp. K7 TaxID=2218606 RepID=UPI000DA9A5EE|nr:ATP synthase F1 subunit delta [Mesonia sp. K7]PZD79079.1 ATP synthase F1 subunit delta [Mesonia sp. K7]